MKKVEQSIRLLQQISDNANGRPIELAYSGGKDSDVILRLARLAGIPFVAVYKNTTIDPPGTIEHCRNNGVEIRQPKLNFWELLEKNKSYPTRNARYCCRSLKKYPTENDIVILGIRSCESEKRAVIYKEPTQCKIYSKKKRVEQVMPLLNWTDADELQFIKEQNIRLHPLYYSAGGEIDMSKRLGCIGCPLKSRLKRCEDFLKYPKMLRLWIKAGFRHYGKDVYMQMARMLFFDNKEQFVNYCDSTLFGENDTKKQLENYFGIDLSL